jgi:hypothetical protein
MKNAYKISLANFEGKKAFRRSMRMWEGNIKTDLESAQEGIFWLYKFWRIS